MNLGSKVILGNLLMRFGLYILGGLILVHLPLPEAIWQGDPSGPMGQQRPARILLSFAHLRGIT